MYRNGSYLAHYGVKGMKWGVRKSEKRTGLESKKSVIKPYDNKGDFIDDEGNLWRWDPKKKVYQRVASQDNTFLAKVSRGASDLSTRAGKAVEDALNVVKTPSKKSSKKLNAQKLTNEIQGKEWKNASTDWGYQFSQMAKRGKSAVENLLNIKKTPMKTAKKSKVAVKATNDIRGQSWKNAKPDLGYSISQAASRGKKAIENFLNIKDSGPKTPKKSKAAQELEKKLRGG